MSGRPFVDNIIWKIFIHIALGLEYLHSQNIIHRDLKSLNIFMMKDGVAKVGDLGCAKKLEKDEIDESETQTETVLQRTTSSYVADIPEEAGSLAKLDDNPFDVIDEDLLTGRCDTLLSDLGEHQGSGADQLKEEEEEERVGTPYYLSPELWKKCKCTKKSDIWALGVILYELCCLKYPFPAKEQDELMNKVLNDKPEIFPNHVSKEFQDMIKQMLRKDPSKRPCIQELIYSDTFQNKAQQHLITLPMHLNKSKLKTKFELGQLDKLDFQLSQHQLKLLGFKENNLKAPESGGKDSRPSSRVSLLQKNIARGNLLKEEEKKKAVESPLKTERNSEPDRKKTTY